MRTFVVLAVLSSLLALSSAAAPDATARHVVVSRSVVPAGFTRSPRAVADADLDATNGTVIVGLRQRNLDKLEALFWEVSTPGSPQYRQFLTQEEVLAIVAPRDEAVEAVRAWLLQHVEAGALTFMGDAFELQASHATLARMFGARLFAYRRDADGARFVRAWGDVSVPRALADHVAVVVGLNEFVDAPHKPILKLKAGQPAIVPQTIHQIYQTPFNESASTTSSRGVIEFQGQSYTPTDLATYANYMASNIPPLSPSHVVGPNDPSQPGTESELDIEMITGIGDGIKSWFWLEDPQNWVYGFAKHFFSASARPMVASISYGWAESGECQFGNGCSSNGWDSQQLVDHTNVEFQKIGLLGVSLLVSSGDSGANGRSDELCLLKRFIPVFPADSPYVTAVGATQLNDAQSSLPNPPPACKSVTCASGGTEVAVSYDVSGFASGGGFSDYLAQPSYQSAAVANYLKNASGQLPPQEYFNATGRGYPDVAAFGDNCLIVQGGQLQGVGGTSCSAPIWGGVVSNLNVHALTKDGKPLGFLNPLIYKMAAEEPTTFNDVLVGDNHCTESGCGLFGSCKGFKCTSGWDPVTGFGTPNYPKMLAYITKLLDAQQ